MWAWKDEAKEVIRSLRFDRLKHQGYILDRLTLNPQPQDISTKMLGLSNARTKSPQVLALMPHVQKAQYNPTNGH